MTYLVCGGQLVKDNVQEIIQDTINNKSVFCYTNKPEKNRGKWYYELKYISGTTKAFLPAWWGKKGYFGFYPKKQNSAYTWSSPSTISFLVDGETKYDIQMNLEGFLYEETIGMGFDIDNKIMYFRSGINIREYKLQTTDTHFQPYIYEAKPANAINKDTVKVTFDPKYFRYSMPDGYLPWGYRMRGTCQNKRHVFLFSLFLMVFILVTSN